MTAGAVNRYPWWPRYVGGGDARPDALALIITGTGHRTARAYEGRAPGAPLLHLAYAPTQ